MIEFYRITESLDTPPLGPEATMDYVAQWTANAFATVSLKATEMISDGWDYVPDSMRIWHSPLRTTVSATMCRPIAGEEKADAPVPDLVRQIEAEILGSPPQ